MARRDEIDAFLGERPGASCRCFPLRCFARRPAVHRRDRRFVDDAATPRSTRAQRSACPLGKERRFRKSQSAWLPSRRLQANGAIRLILASSSASTASDRNASRLRCSRQRSAIVSASLVRDMPGRGDSEWLADPNDYIVSHLLDDADGARCAHAAVESAAPGSAPRWAGCSAWCWRRGESTPIVAAGRQRCRPSDRVAGAGADPLAMSVPIRTFGSFAAYRSAHIREVSGAVRRAVRCAVAARWRRPTARQRPDGSWRLNTIPASPCRSVSRRRTGATSGRYGTRSRARHWSCVARNRICSRRRPPRRCACEAPKPRLIEFAGIGHAPMLLDAEQIASGRGLSRRPCRASTAIQYRRIVYNRPVTSLPTLLSLALSLPPIDERPAPNPPEMRGRRKSRRGSTKSMAAGIDSKPPAWIGDALTATNRVAISRLAPPGARREVLHGRRHALADSSSATSRARRIR